MLCCEIIKSWLHLYQLQQHQSCERIQFECQIRVASLYSQPYMALELMLLTKDEVQSLLDQQGRRICKANQHHCHNELMLNYVLSFGLYSSVAVVVVDVEVVDYLLSCSDSLQQMPSYMQLSMKKPHGLPCQMLQLFLHPCHLLYFARQVVLSQLLLHHQLRPLILPSLLRIQTALPKMTHYHFLILL